MSAPRWKRTPRCIGSNAIIRDKYIVGSKRQSEIIEVVCSHKKKYKAHGGGIFISNYSAQLSSVPKFEELISSIAYSLPVSCKNDLSAKLGCQPYYLP